MLERPTKLDWLVYKLFIRIWNPIFNRKPWLLFGLKRSIDRWVFDFDRSRNVDLTYDEWLVKVREGEIEDALKKQLP
jgi:hypothetical protein